MTSWLLVAVLGGLVGLDTTSFPQAMISRPLVAGTLTGALFGRPMEGLAVGFVLEAFSLLILPIGAARYPEGGTATVAATSAYLAVTTPAGLSPGALALVVAFALGWEWVGGESVVLLRRTNGQILLKQEGVSGRALERRHLTAMALDFVRGGVVSAGGGVIAAGVLEVVAPLWDLNEGSTMAVLAVLTAAMIGTAVPIFGGIRARRTALATGMIVGLVLASLLP